MVYRPLALPVIYSTFGFVISRQLFYFSVALTWRMWIPSGYTVSALLYNNAISVRAHNNSVAYLVSFGGNSLSGHRSLSSSFPFSPFEKKLSSSLPDFPWQLPQNPSQPSRGSLVVRFDPQLFWESFYIPPERLWQVFFCFSSVVAGYHFLHCLSSPEEVGCPGVSMF